MLKIAKEITSEGKKSTLRMEKNSCKQRYPQGVYIQHIQTACTVQYQKPNNPIKKINQRSKCTFLQRRRRDGYKAHKKMLSLTSSQRKTNQMYNEVSPHIDQNGLIKNPTTVNSAEAVERREPSCTVGGSVNQYTHQGEHYGSQEAKHRSTK